MGKNKLFIFLLIIIIAALLIGGSAFLLKNNKPIVTPPVENQSGIEIFAPKENEAISSPLKITGRVKGNGWTGFEGQVGIVKLFDNDGKELAMGILTATEDWMKLPVNFETTLWFDYPGDGAGQLVFYNENASGEPERDKTFTLPIKLKKSSGEKSTVKVYFSGSGDNIDCAKVLPFEREVPKTQALARVALEELLKGPADLEKTAGLFTSINPGVVILSLSIENGIAKVDFNDQLQKGVAGSCKVTAIRAQIEQTLKQFPTVKNVVISINGETEDILQP